MSKERGTRRPRDRVVAGLLLLSVGLFVLGGFGGSLVGLVVAAVGLIPLITRATGRCPTFVLLGIDTLPEGPPALAH